MNQNKPYNEWVIDCRRARGWNQAELAKRAGISIPTLRKLEKKSGFSPKTMLKIATVFNNSSALVPDHVNVSS